MKNFLLIGVLMVFAIQLQAQEPVCMPDTAFAGFDAGVYPLPVSEAFPDQGITDTACLNAAFNFVFTVVTPDTIAIPFGAIVLESPLDSITIATEGAIGGLPVGIDYACNPPNCVFTPEVGLGCIVLSGTPTDAEDVGENPLSISADVFLPALSIPVNFPDPALFPGDYSLVVWAEEDPRCLSTNTSEEMVQIEAFSISPNPTTGRTELFIESLENGIYQLETFDLLGKRIKNEHIRLFEGGNRISFDGHQLSEGMYIVSLSNGQGRLSRRLVISR